MDAQARVHNFLLADTNTAALIPLLMPAGYLCITQQFRTYSGGVNDGIRTRDHRNHNPALYQLSYAHHGRINKPTTVAKSLAVQKTNNVSVESNNWPYPAGLFQRPIFGQEILTDKHWSG